MKTVFMDDNTRPFQMQNVITIIPLRTCGTFWVDEYVKNILNSSNLAELSAALHQEWWVIPQHQICLVEGMKSCTEAVISVSGDYTRYWTYKDFSDTLRTLLQIISN